MNMLRSPIAGDAVALDGAAMNRHELAEDVVVADPKRSRLALVATVLGALAEDGPVADEVFAPIVSGPHRQACASITHPGPISTSPSMIA